jgi:quinol monooxygenase YgiN
MIREYIRYRIPPERADAFLAAYQAAAAALRASPHCLGYDLARCEEDAQAFILRIEWDSTEGHLQGFRRSPEFGPFLAQIRGFIPEIEEMRHYAGTGLTFTRGAAP